MQAVLTTTWSNPARRRPPPALKRGDARSAEAAAAIRLGCEVPLHGPSVKLVNSHTGTKKSSASAGRQVRCGARLSRSVIAASPSRSLYACRWSWWKPAQLSRIQEKSSAACS